MAKSHRLSDEALQELLALMGQADSVELKLTLPESDRQHAMTALGVDPLDAYMRQVYFFDTPDLTLYKHGVVVRGRRSQGRPDDSVVKLRPVIPSELPSSVRKSKRLGVEVDAMPGGHVCSASLKGQPGAGYVRDAALGRRPVRKLFSKEQRAFFTEYGPPNIKLDDLKILGPLNVLKLKFSPEGYDRKLVVEMWFYPGGSRILELSTKCAPDEAFQVSAEARAFLSGRGVNLSGEQETKTRTALEFFSQAEEGSS
jgi:hypothetical protein